MNEQQPYYARNLSMSLKGMYGHNILGLGDTSVSGRLFSSITAVSGCDVSYTKYTGIASDGDATVSSMSLSTGTTIFTGAITNVTISGLGSKALLQILDIS